MSVSVPPPSGSTSRLAFPGAILTGRYRLEEVVGHGGMGSVWRATHIGLGEAVAVKLVAANFARYPEALRRFDVEAKSAAKLRSRHVPQVFDNGVLEDGTPFLVMELLHGESLAARVNRLGPVPLHEVVSIVEQAGRALARAHSLGIVHRDIKPENVYLAQSFDEDGYVVKVLDFGIAKVASSLSEDARSSTRTGTLLGTPLYMSPEQARGLRSVDFKTDLYSLGLVAFTMLTGQVPFGGETLGELLLQICVQPLPSLRVSAPTLPPSVDDWFQKACARLPEDRFVSAQAMVEGLRVAAGMSSPGASDSAMGRLPAFGGLAPSPSGGGLPPGPTGPEALRAPSTTSGTEVGAVIGGPPRARRVLLVAAAVGVVALAGVALAVVFVRDRKGVEAAAPTVLTAEVSTGAAHAPSPSPALPPEPEAGAAAALAPLPAEPPAPIAPSAPTSVHTASPAAATVIARPPAPQATAAAPARTSTPQPKATAQPHNSAKPTGAIDLGY